MDKWAKIMNKNKKVASFPAETNRDGILKKIIY